MDAKFFGELIEREQLLLPSVFLDSYSRSPANRTGSSAISSVRAVSALCQLCTTCTLGRDVPVAPSAGTMINNRAPSREMS
jgi:hypothetical protein